MPNSVRLQCILAVLALGGCSVYPRQFTVETQPGPGPEPLIYAPGTMPGEPLSILVPDVMMACSHIRIEVCRSGICNTLTKPDVVFSFDLTRRLVEQRDLSTGTISAYAKFDAGNMRKAAEAIASRPQDAGKRLPSIRESLAAEISGAEEKCKLGFSGAEATASAVVIAQYTAERILHGLPRPFSSVAAISYNHQITGDKAGHVNVGHNGFSLDISEGMRLRLENSLPIAPGGINMPGIEHPSSIAAPSFVYFNPITKPQICDVDTYPVEQGQGAQNLCLSKESDEKTVYLSPAAEMLRYGARQIHQTEKKPGDRTENKQAERSQSKQTTDGGVQYYAHGVDVSSVIDLLEPAAGVGVWRYWRLWSPYDRPTKNAVMIGNETGGGSTEDPTIPILIAANDLRTLDNVVDIPGSTHQPCEYGDSLPKSVPERSTWQCYYFHYRVVPIPEIALRVNGVERWVPVGTTLHDIIAPWLRTDLIQGTALMGYPKSAGSEVRDRLLERSRQQFLKHVRISRMFDGTRYPLRADHLDAAGSSSPFLRLQLLPGDDIAW